MRQHGCTGIIIIQHIRQRVKACVKVALFRVTREWLTVLNRDKVKYRSKDAPPMDAQEFRFFHGEVPLKS